jgi:Zn-dependent peptidase ImmA (M78 family)
MREVWREGKIGSQAWSIVLVDLEDMAGSEDAKGLCVHEQNEIWILKSEAAHDGRFWDTLMHELIHAACHVFHVRFVKDEEESIRRLVPALLATLDGFQLLPKLGESV